MTPYAGWTAFVEEYVTQHEQRRSEPVDHVASRAAELIAADLREHRDEDRRREPITALDQKCLEVAQRLLLGTGFRALSARDWEAALMLEADSRLSSTGRPARLEAQFVTTVCAQLAATMTGLKPTRKL
jgi:hypothetical protein